MVWKFFCRCIVPSLMASVLLPTSFLLAANRKPTVGSPDVAIADPTVPRPTTKPCEVSLFRGENFGEKGDNKRMDATPHPYSYQPPAACKGPWAKVVLEADFSVDPGHQYDRTVYIWLGGVNLYFGTTQEPSPEVGPGWHVERDLTDYSSLFKTPQSGSVMINNWIDDLRASVIHGAARLLFYPAAADAKAPRAANLIYPLGDDKGVVANLQTGEEKLSRTITLPQNMDRMYLDLFAQGQLHDEFWYNCLPDQYIDQTAAFAMRRGYSGAPVKPRGCGGGNFREAEVSIDNKPGALAPIYPWIFTGGIDPYLWRPTPGIQTLNFMPYRVDLTPFAGALSDGAPHTVSIRVFGANQYFSVTGTLLVYQDAKAAHTGGAVTANTLVGQPTVPAIRSTLGNGAQKVNGDILTKEQQQYVIEGYVNTSRGRVKTRVEQRLDFTNRQSFSTVDEHTYRQVTDQVIDAQGVSTATAGSAIISRARDSLHFPLHVDVLKPVATDETYTRIIDLHQGYEKKVDLLSKGTPDYTAQITNSYSGHDKSTFDPAHRTMSGNSGQRSTQSFQFGDSLGGCYRSEVTATEGKVSAYSAGEGCPGGVNHVEWFVHPDGSPYAVDGR
jgi:Peptide N-acetyl-beta-D-glucosaminyl asparaginase amidase A